MSKVMQALDQSERLNQSLHRSTHSAHPLSLPAAQSSSSWLNVLAVILPPILVGGGMTYQTYHDYLAAWRTDNIAETILVEKPFEFNVVSAPDFGRLATTYKVQTEPSETLLESVVSAPQPVNSEPVFENQDNSDDELLDGLDLSQLSPELAQRFQSALTEKVESKPVATNASNLAQNAEQWYGKLPPLNFQTHVFSSKPSKRWVKVNGVEYSQGDWLNDDIELVAIEQQSCLIRFQGELVEVPALYDWQG
ncbi:general secretion pathway protein GspB [Vibrio aquaticus]|uniref:General secretion pathway protein GspB n=1 Tax=Vibrio aquaticus TaxID=2496559 RepID=A0A432CYW8_9VIBR|nr:general secretion pathway protein GspB [Vibrio aquaticus]RTZ15960.1 general secretion pathway protein GspB [Vibrio aquaticus]